MNVNTKSTVISQGDSSLASGIRRVRKSKGLNQAEFGKLFGVSQGAISNWEMGLDVPSFRYLQQLSLLTSDQTLLEYLERERKALLGDCVTIAEIGSKREMRRIPVLWRPSALGTKNSTREDEIREILELPVRWFSPGGEFYAVNASGSSMLPIVKDGSLIIVDTSKRNPSELVQSMVAVREAEGVACYWLREDRDIFLLMPQTVENNSPIRIMRREGEFSLLGEVVLTIGMTKSKAAKRK